MPAPMGLRAQMFADPEIHKFFEREGVLFTNWKEIMQRWEERYGDTLPRGKNAPQ